MEALKKSDLKLKTINGDPFFFGPPMFGCTAMLDTSSMTLDEAWEYGQWKDYIKKNEQPAWNKEVKEREREFIIEIIKEDKEWVKARRLDYLRAELERIKPEIKEYSSRMGGDNEYIDEAIFATYLQPLLRRKKSLEFEIYGWDHPNTSGKITKTDVERAKEFPIQDILGEPDRKGGNKLFYKSPFRQEKTASFCVYLDSNTYHDFGSPDENGDVISLIMRMRDLEFLEAVKFILHK